MVWNGYLELGGVPLINAEATEAYVAHLAPTMALRSLFQTDRVHIANEEAPYRTPLLDQAAWVNPLDPATHDFLGLYPIELEGLDGSTLQAPVIEYLTNGGSAGSQRDTTRAVRVTGLLVGRSMLAAQAGLEWLSAALRSDDCLNCDSGTLRYFLAEPDVCETGAFAGESGTDSISFGDLGVGVYRYRWQPDRVPTGMPMRAHWEADWAEGTEIRYGAVPKDSITPLQSSDIVRPFRVNYVLNPTFRTSLSGWSATGAGTSTWRDSGDQGNPGYASLVALASSAPADPGTDYGSGVYGEGPYGSGGYGADVPDQSARITGTTDTMPAGPVGISLDLRGSSVTVRVRSLDTIIAERSLTLTSDWVRYTLTGAIAAANGLTIEIVTQDAADVDRVLIEAGSPGAYFDGSTVENEYTYTWAGATDISASRRRWTGITQIQRDNSDFRPFLEVVSGTARGAQLTWYVRREQGMSEQLLPYERHLFDVDCTAGPSVLQRVDTNERGAYIQVEFTLVAGKPSPFTLPTPVDTTPLASAIYADPDATIDLGDDLSWLSDPNSVTVSRAPSAPVIQNPAIESISSWRRYYVPIQAEAIADWGSAVPTMAITSLADPITQVRVRFHPNPFGYAADAVDPANYCSEFIVSYLPALTRLEVDGVFERALASRGDRASAAADHLLYGSGGGPVTWPALSCAIPYVMTVDVPPAGTIDQFALELSLRRTV